MSRQITPSTTLENLKHEAKRWLKALRSNDREAHVRLQSAMPNAAPSAPVLRDVQHALAREYGLDSWTALRDRLAQDGALRRYERVAEALVAAYAAPDEAAMRVVWHYFGHWRAWDAMRRYVRLDLGKTEEPNAGEDDTLTLTEARYLVARFQGFENWDALAAFATALPPGASTVVEKLVTVYAQPSGKEKREPALRSRDWEEILEALEDEKLNGLDASGQMTDAVLERLSHVEHITSLDLGGSRGLSDDGLRHLARLPGLRHLNLQGCGISDRGLEVLRRLPELETLALTWNPITDTGAAHMASCHRLRAVDLTGTATGDGAILALAGKDDLSDFRSGGGVTDLGLGYLKELPVFRTWRGGIEEMALLRPDSRPNFLILRGPFTNDGMAALSALEGLFGLNLDNDQLAVTGACLAHLVHLPHLAMLGFDAKDESMPYIAALPRLRFLMCQDTPASDDGFVALSRSQSIEHIWGRRCYNLQRRGFMALADMPALRHLSVSCKNVDDEGLAALPRFPALRELMPMDIPDDGYRHIAGCAQLDSLVLMYCRDTGDAATEHIVKLPALRKYFASYNRITDRTPTILSGMDSLEEITFDSCAGLSDAGVATLARLPTLRELRVESMPKVTQQVVTAFGPHVRVHFAL